MVRVTLGERLCGADSELLESVQIAVVYEYKSSSPHFYVVRPATHPDES